MPALLGGAPFGVSGDEDGPAGVGRLGGAQRVAEGGDVGAKIGGVAEEAGVERQQEVADAHRAGPLRVQGIGDHARAGERSSAAGYARVMLHSRPGRPRGPKPVACRRKPRQPASCWCAPNRLDLRHHVRAQPAGGSKTVRMVARFGSERRASVCCEVTLVGSSVVTRQIQ